MSEPDHAGRHHSILFRSPYCDDLRIRPAIDSTFVLLDAATGNLPVAVCSTAGKKQPQEIGQNHLENHWVP